MRRSSTDESAYRRSPSPEGQEPGFARGGPFRRGSSLGGRAGAGAFFGPKAAQARSTSPKGSKYVVFYLDLSFIFLLELKRCSMARGCLQGVKYLMFAFNLLFWLGGCGVLGVGIWLAATQGNFATLSSSFPSLSAANLLIATGTFVMAIGFVGCIGAIKENKCLLLTTQPAAPRAGLDTAAPGPQGLCGRGGGLLQLRVLVPSPWSCLRTCWPRAALHRDFTAPALAVPGTPSKCTSGGDLWSQGWWEYRSWAPCTVAWAGCRGFWGEGRPWGGVRVPACPHRAPLPAVLRAAAAGVPARSHHRGAVLGLHGADRQVCPARPEEGPAPVRHEGQRGPHQRLEHHPDRLPLLRRLQLHRLVRGVQRHARARLLLPGVQRELWAARTRHLVEGALLRDGEGLAPGEPAGRGHLWAVHGARADSGPDLRHDHVLPGGKGGHLLRVARPTPLLLCQRTPCQGDRHGPALSRHRTRHGGGAASAQGPVLGGPSSGSCRVSGPDGGADRCWPRCPGWGGRGFRHFYIHVFSRAALTVVGPPAPQDTLEARPLVLVLWWGLTPLLAFHGGRRPRCILIKCVSGSPPRVSRPGHAPGAAVASSASHRAPRAHRGQLSKRLPLSPRSCWPWRPHPPSLPVSLRGALPRVSL